VLGDGGGAETNSILHHFLFQSRSKFNIIWIPNLLLHSIQFNVFIHWCLFQPTLQVNISCQIFKSWIMLIWTRLILYSNWRLQKCSLLALLVQRTFFNKNFLWQALRSVCSRPWCWQTTTLPPSPWRCSTMGTPFASRPNHTCKYIEFQCCECGSGLN
jgi:hypothetical protein